MPADRASPRETKSGAPIVVPQPRAYALPGVLDRREAGRPGCSSPKSSHAGWPCGRFCFWCKPVTHGRLIARRTPRLDARPPLPLTRAFRRSRDSLALAAEACDCELQNAQFVPQQQSARHSSGLSQNGALGRPHHVRPRLADSGGCRSATNREQGCAALGAVALPAGTTVGEGHLARVGDGDLFAADASALWVGLRCLWVPCARFNHGQAAYSRPIGLPAGAANQPRADFAAGASAGEAHRCIGSGARDCRTVVMRR